MSPMISTMRSRSVRRSGLVVAVALLVAAGVGALRMARPSPDDRSLVLAQADEMFPARSLRDVVSFADHAAIITVLTERERPMSAEEQAAGEGYASRVLTVRFEKPLWSRAGAPPLPAEATFEGWGWSVKDGEKIPMAGGDGPRMEVGERFLSPLVQLDGTWGPYSYTTVLPLKGDTITAIGRPRSSYIIGERVVGETVEGFVASLRSTAPYPIAAANASLSVRERLALVRVKEKAEGGSTPGPGP